MLELEIEGGVEGKYESSFKETLKVEDVPPSAVLPEMLVMLKFSLPDTDGAEGALVQEILSGQL